MYKFPDISRWFDIVDYVEYNGCRKIEVNMKNLSPEEISEFCNEFALFICRLRCPSQDWLLKMERAIKGVAGLDVTDKIVLRNMFYTGFISDIRYKETGDYLQSFDDEGIKGYFGECFYYILRDQILEDEKVYIEPRFPKNSSKVPGIDFVDINSTYGAGAYFPEQMEFSIPGGIKPSEIVGAYKKQGGKNHRRFYS